MRPDFERSGGLIRVIAQCSSSHVVLMDAYMNEEAFDETVRTGKVVYFSRTKGRLWRKGEESGNIQLVREIRINCNLDSVLVLVEQIGGAACHTGYRTCFYRRIESDGSLTVVGERVFDPSHVYRK
ncbi:MAG: phosphoribosyl-AMP cyclohydrolase [Patescibacteria group bacterium]|mgnify:FL=1